jgi:hypothetical protein
VLVSASSTSRLLVHRIARQLGLTAVGVRGPRPREVATIARPRVGLYKPWVENIDEGWTRWLLERYEFAFASLSDADIRAGGLAGRVDVIILPSGSPERLVAGHANGTLPDVYTGGLGEGGVGALQQFVKAGGTLLCLDASCGLAVDALSLPVKDVVRAVPAEKFFCPGSILRLRLDPTHPLSFGLGEETVAFFANSSGYEIARRSVEDEGERSTNGTNGGARTEPVAWYGNGNPLLSGWIEGPELIAGTAAVVEARVGRGRVVLIGFRAQHRAQTHATFRLLFNTLYTHRTTATRQ